MRWTEREAYFHLVNVLADKRYFTPKEIRKGLDAYLEFIPRMRNALIDDRYGYDEETPLFGEAFGVHLGYVSLFKGDGNEECDRLAKQAIIDYNGRYRQESLKVLSHFLARGRFEGRGAQWMPLFSNQFKSKIQNLNLSVTDLEGMLAILKTFPEEWVGILSALSGKSGIADGLVWFLLDLSDASCARFTKAVESRDWDAVVTYILYARLHGMELDLEALGSLLSVPNRVLEKVVLLYLDCRNIPESRALIQSHFSDEYLLIGQGSRDEYRSEYSWDHPSGNELAFIRESRRSGALETHFYCPYYGESGEKCASIAIYKKKATLSIFYLKDGRIVTTGARSLRDKEISAFQELLTDNEVDRLTFFPAWDKCGIGRGFCYYRMKPEGGFRIVAEDGPRDEYQRLGDFFLRLIDGNR